MAIGSCRRYYGRDKLTLLEVLVQPLRQDNQSLVSAYEKLLTNTEIRLVAVTTDILRSAATLRAEQDVPAESLMAAKLSEARDLRAKLMSAAKSLAENGLIPHAEVAVIATGSGTRDRAEDCVALSALLRNHAVAIAGKHPIATEQIDQAAAVGSWLLANLRPTDAPHTPSTGPSPAVEIRNGVFSRNGYGMITQ